MELTVERRDIFGKGVRALRMRGFIPGELYGQGIPNVHVSISLKEFRSVLKGAGENTLITVLIGGIEKRPALIYDVIKNPLSGDIQHVDLYQVRMDAVICTRVPLEFIGESPALKTGGLLVRSVQEIDVEALPADLPRVIRVDVTRLTALHESLYVRDILVGSRVKILTEPGMIIASIIAQTTEDEERAAGAQTVPSIEAVKVETEEKKALRAAATSEKLESKK